MYEIETLTTDDRFSSFMNSFSEISVELGKNRSQLFIGLDKWTIEKLITEPFFWYTEPFKKSRCSGFISPETKIARNFPMLLIMDLDEDIEINITSFRLKKKIFFASEWNRNVKKIATYVSDIFLFRGNRLDVIKKDFKMKKK